MFISINVYNAEPDTWKEYWGRALDHSSFIFLNPTIVPFGYLTIEIVGNHFSLRQIYILYFKIADHLIVLLHVHSILPQGMIDAF